MANNQKLTAKQERFAQLVASGQTHADALRLAYDCNRAADTTVWADATRLVQHPLVSPRIEALLEQQAIAANITPTAVLASVASIADEARQSEQYGPAIRANELLGRHVGLFAEHSTSDVRITHELDAASIEDLRQLLAETQSQRVALQASAEVIEGEESPVADDADSQA